MILIPPTPNRYHRKRVVLRSPGYPSYTEYIFCYLCMYFIFCVFIFAYFFYAFYANNCGTQWFGLVWFGFTVDTTRQSHAYRNMSSLIDTNAGFNTQKNPQTVSCLILTALLMWLAAAYRGFLYGFLVLLGVDRCSAASASWFSLPRSLAQHALCGEWRGTYPPAYATESRICWPCCFCKCTPLL